ncbi:hypothetical protein GCM10023216_28070 [Isoptericola chiayiensis]|uniref:Uncharacterized protein n=1 Tax=Isoptericola chiayiensis TaxID=579446 RepID=A0ABP8YN32_9MICO|nr:hypothetical protein [Isoptericola chiayiensis]NOW02272.1 hypothetical protein [Isoptericola chiayiensis]
MVRRRSSARGPVQIDLSADSAETSDGGTGAGGDVSGAAGSDGEPVTPGWFARRVAGPLAARWRGLTPELPGSASLLAVDGAPFLADRFRESYAEQDDDRMVQTSDSALVGLTG